MPEVPRGALRPCVLSVKPQDDPHCHRGTHLRDMALPAVRARRFLVLHRTLHTGPLFAVLPRVAAVMPARQ